MRRTIWIAVAAAIVALTGVETAAARSGRVRGRRAAQLRERGAVPRAELHRRVGQRRPHREPGPARLLRLRQLRRRRVRHRRHAGLDRRGAGHLRAAVRWPRLRRPGLGPALRAPQRGRALRRPRCAGEPRLVDAGLPCVEPERMRRAPPAAAAAPVPNGTPASPNARLTAQLERGRARQTVRFGGDATVRIGLVDEAGRPIAGAALQALTREIRSGSEWQLAPALTTDAGGRARLPLAAGSSRRVRLEYRAQAGDGEPAAAPRCGCTCAPASP